MQLSIKDVENSGKWYCIVLYCFAPVTGLTLGHIQYPDLVTDPEQLRVELTGLEPDTHYRIFLAGVTRVGKGRDIFLDVKTTELEGERIILYTCKYYSNCIYIILEVNLSPSLPPSLPPLLTQ